MKWKTLDSVVGHPNRAHSACRYRDNVAKTTGDASPTHAVIPMSGRPAAAQGLRPVTQARHGLPRGPHNPALSCVCSARQSPAGWGEASHLHTELHWRAAPGRVWLSVSAAAARWGSPSIVEFPHRSSGFEPSSSARCLHDAARFGSRFSPRQCTYWMYLGEGVVGSGMCEPNAGLKGRRSCHAPHAGFPAIFPSPFNQFDAQCFPQLHPALTPARIPNRHRFVPCHRSCLRPHRRSTTACSYIKAQHPPPLDPILPRPAALLA